MSYSFRGEEIFPAKITFALEQNLRGPSIYTGTASTRDDVRAQVSTDAEIGSLYLSLTGKLYLKVAAAGITTDWQRVTASAAD